MSIQSAGKWAAINNIAQQGTRFVVSIILANILPPEEFGLLAMVSVFTMLSSVIVDSGLSGALIQRQDITNKDRSTVFWFNLAAALVVILILNLAAGSIAAFFHEPRIELILRVISMGLLFGAFGSCQAAVREKKMEFKELMMISYPALVVSSVCGIAMALLGWGVWALVAQGLISILMNSAVLWIKSDWKPRFEFDRSRFKLLFSYGGNMAGAALLDKGFQNVYVLVIAKLFPPRRSSFLSTSPKSSAFTRAAVHRCFGTGVVSSDEPSPG